MFWADEGFWEWTASILWPTTCFSDTKSVGKKKSNEVDVFRECSFFIYNKKQESGLKEKKLKQKKKICQLEKELILKEII